MMIAGMKAVTMDVVRSSQAWDIFFEVKVTALLVDCIETIVRIREGSKVTAKFWMRMAVYITFTEMGKARR